MRTFKWWILGLLLATPMLAAPSFAVDGPITATDNVKARLVSEAAAVGPGQSVWVALEFTIRDGWHTYWRNPGDSGQATTLQWSLPAGFTAGDILRRKRVGSFARMCVVLKMPPWN
jgi:thiol:disulfide interchange protein DsbD